MATWTLLATYVAVTLWEIGLRLLNLRHLRVRGGTVPPELEGFVEPATLRRIAAYTVDVSRLGLVRSGVHAVILVAFLFGGGLAWYDRTLREWTLSRTDSFLVGGIVFFLGLLAAETALGIPFGLYRSFRVEARHGFNTTTGRLWLVDLVKSTALGAVLVAAVVAGALALVRWSPGAWWIWVWAFFLGVSLFLMFVSPYVIEPLFFRFRPVEAEGLEERIRTLAGRVGVRVSRILQVDASRRSRHSNAYFTGIGRVKRIILFDTLLERMGSDEVLAVLAHELGHWKRRHVVKGLLAGQATSFAGLFLAFHLVRWDGLPGLFGLADASFYARAVMVGFLGSLASVVLTPLGAWWSRRHEWEADRFAADLTGRPGDLADALARLARDNLSNLHPHPLYAAFHGSHPPVAQRVRALRGT
ncbi:MAG: M48 family metallopeptidase [Acidobacteriota bacterium]|jgi:STE24 endopeptidase